MRPDDLAVTLPHSKSPPPCLHNQQAGGLAGAMQDEAAGWQRLAEHNVQGAAKITGISQESDSLHPVRQP